MDVLLKLHCFEFITTPKDKTDGRDRIKIVGTGGYSARMMEGILTKRRKENETEQC